MFLKFWKELKLAGNLLAEMVKLHTEAPCM